MRANSELRWVTECITQVTGNPFAVPACSPGAAAVHPSGNFVFATCGASILAYAVNSTSGALTAIAGSPFAAGAKPRTVAADPTGRFLYVGNHALAPAESSISAFSINPTTGSLTQIAGSPFASNETSFITLDPRGEFLYVASENSSLLTVYAVNSVTGALTATGSPIPNGAGTHPVAIAILK